MRLLGVLALLALFTAAGLGVGAALPSPSPSVLAPSPSVSSPSVSPSPSAALPLAGVRIALDPGHQLGNRNFASEINRPVEAGGFTKACNTTGTATDAGLPEATFTWEVARLVRTQLERLGAEVFLTRSSNSDDQWGPCVDERGRHGARVRASVAVSLHADGASATASGFHVIVPGVVPGFTDDIAEGSRRLGEALRRGLDRVGLTRSTYVLGGLHSRSDLGTLNLSDVPIAMLELGNMRNPDEAEQMSSPAGRQVYADGVVAGIRGFLGR